MESIYIYALNGPLVYVDVNGQWPFYVHNEIYRAAFRNVLGGREIREVMSASWAADFGPKMQDPSNSHIHSMCTPGQSREICVQHIHRQLYDSLDRASRLSNGGMDLNKSALQVFGFAVHTLTDMGSPERVGAEGAIPWNPDALAVHIWGERDATVDWARTGQSIRLALAGAAYAFPKRFEGKNLSKLADRAIEDFVDGRFRATPDGSGVIAGEGARQCALGNPAACGLR